MNLDNYRRNYHLRQRGLKYCSSCEQELPLDQFRPSEGTRQRYCIPCQNRYQADWLARKTATDHVFAARVRERDRQAKRAKYAKQMSDADAYEALLQRKRDEKNARMAALRTDPVAHAAWKARANALRQASRARAKAEARAATEAVAQTAAAAAQAALEEQERAARYAQAQALAHDLRAAKRRAGLQAIRDAHMRALERRRLTL